MVSNNSSLGSDLAEIGHALGLTGQDPALPGDPAALQETAQHLCRLGAAADKAASGFAAIDTGRWHGAAADGFREFLDTSPPRWRTAADAFEKAGTAVARYAQVLAESQQQAGQAHQQLAEAAQRSQQARQAHNAKVDAYNAAHAGGPAPAPPPAAFVDPAAEQHAQAQHQLDRARAAVQQHGDEAARAVTDAANAAPGKPGWFIQLASTVGDAFQEEGRALGSMVSGAGEAIGGMAQLSRAVNPLDPWNQTHPAQAVHNASTLAAGMAEAVTHPYQGVKIMADVDGWRRNPAHALGSCIPNAIASMAGGGGIAARVATGARRAGRVGTAAAETSRAGRAAEHVEHIEQRGQHATETTRAGHQPGTQWGRWPERAAQRPDITAAHHEPRNRLSAANASSEQGHLDPAHHAGHEQPWRPSDGAPSRLGDRDFHEPATERDPLSAHTPRQPERLAHPGAEAHGPHLDHGRQHAHEPGRDLQPHDRGEEPHHGGHRGDGQHEHDPAQDHDHHHDSDHQPRHEEPHHDPDSPEHHAPDLSPPPDVLPRFEGTPLRPDFHGEQHGDVFDTPVRYLDHVELQRHKLHVDDDGLLRDVDGDLFDTTHGDSLHNPQGGRAIFVMDQHGDIFASLDQKEGRFHHSSFLGGEPVGAAGELGAKDGKVQLISNHSGHYRPTKTATNDFIKHLYNDKGAFFDRDNLSVKFAAGSVY